MGATHTVAEGVTLVKTLSFARFDESIEVATKLGVDPRRADQIVRGTVVLPHGTGKQMRVLAIAQGEKEQEARDAGADYVGTEYLERIRQGWLEFDAVVATPNMMGQVGPLGRILGPRGLMPNPKAGTVTFDVAGAVSEIKAGKIEYRVDRTGNLHAPIGRVSFEDSKLSENLGAFMDSVLRARPAAAKGAYVKERDALQHHGAGRAARPPTSSGGADR